MYMYTQEHVLYIRVHRSVHLQVPISRPQIFKQHVKTAPITVTVDLDIFIVNSTNSGNPSVDSTAVLLEAHSTCIDNNYSM